MGGKLWNDIPEFVQHSSDIESFKRNYKMHTLIISSWWMMPINSITMEISVTVNEW